MKLVVDAETDKVLGASMVGPDAPEIMQVFCRLVSAVTMIVEIQNVILFVINISWFVEENRYKFSHANLLHLHELEFE